VGSVCVCAIVMTANAHLATQDQRRVAMTTSRAYMATQKRRRATMQKMFVFVLFFCLARVNKAALQLLCFFYTQSRLAQQAHTLQLRHRVVMAQLAQVLPTPPQCAHSSHSAHTCCVHSWSVTLIRVARQHIVNRRAVAGRLCECIRPCPQPHIDWLSATHLNRNPDSPPSSSS
jgi:hypothetical protein